MEVKAARAVVRAAAPEPRTMMSQGWRRGSVVLKDCMVGVADRVVMDENVCNGFCWWKRSSSTRGCKGPMAIFSWYVYSFTTRRGETKPCLPKRFLRDMKIAMYATFKSRLHGVAVLLVII